MNDKEVSIELRSLSTARELEWTTQIHASIWSEDDIVPTHILLAMVHNGGTAIGAFDGEKMVGFVFGFPGLQQHRGETRVKHCSHEMAVLPEYRDSGLGYKLKRAQWQLVRQQGLEWITWTYDPLQTRNAFLNISKLGAVCNTYFREYYGEMTDSMNAGLSSDRFQVDLWVNSKRVEKRMSRQPRRRLDLAHFLAAEAVVLNTTALDDNDFAVPQQDELPLIENPETRPALVLFEVPANIQQIKTVDMNLARQWRGYSRIVFELLFHNHYIVTDVVYLPGVHPRAYYVLSQGNSTLG